MSQTPSHYELSAEADQDISAILDYTVDEFGLDQAVTYLNDLDRCFAGLVENPEIGRERTEIRPDLRSVTSGRHVVFYRIMTGYIRIIRVLHSSRDLPRHLY